MNKFTKQELIERLEKLQNKIKPNRNKDNDSLIAIIINFLANFKGWLLKLTLFAIIIKTFKKYRIFSLLWRLINWIAVSLFGFSLWESWGFEYLSNFLDWFISNPITQSVKDKVE